MTTQHQAPEVTSEMAAIIERLCRKQQVYNGRNTFRDEFVNPDGPEIAKLLTRATQPLSLTVDEIRDVVEPFAKMGGMLDGPFAPALFKDEDAIGMGAWSENGEPRTITFGDLRRAKAALDRLQSLSLPVDIDRSGLAQEVK